MVMRWLLVTVVVALMMICACFGFGLGNMLLSIMIRSAVFNATAVKPRNHKTQIEKHENAWKDPLLQYIHA